VQSHSKTAVALSSSTRKLASRLAASQRRTRTPLTHVRNAHRRFKALPYNHLMTEAVTRSYRYCEALARREAGNFYPAFRVLPRPQRLATCALYAFLRIADDLSDEPAPIDMKRRRLNEWRRGLEELCRGRFNHASHPALHDAITRYGIPREYLEA